MRKTVLVVDDDPVARRLLVHHLERGGYDVVTAANGREAVAMLEQAEPAMVVTDLEMPEMTGLELCRHIRTFEGFDWLYTIVVTSHADRDRMVEALDTGADDYLTKPFHNRELLARLRAGERIVDLERTLANRNKEIEKAYGELARANDKLQALAQSDDLTGLPNRRSAMSALGEAWRAAVATGTPMACLMLDIDHFKRVNDDHGHAVGDAVLMDVARSMDDTSRADEAVFRLGGEEFLILCPRGTAAMATRAAERMRRNVETLTVVGAGRTLRVTASVGVAERSPEMRTADDLVRAADDALYDAKRAGRNCVRVAPTAPHSLGAARGDESAPGRATA